MYVLDVKQYILNVETKLKQIQDDLDKIKEFIDQMDKEAVHWTVEDVLSVAEQNDIQITVDDAQKVLEDIISHHDAEIGINWNTIDAFLDMWHTKTGIYEQKEF